MGRWTFLSSAVVLLLVVPSSQAFITGGASGVRVHRLEGGANVPCLPIIKENIKLQRSIFRGFREIATTTRVGVPIRLTQPSFRRWGNVLSFVHETLVSLSRRRFARFLAAFVVVMVGQYSLGVGSAMATSTSSVSLLAQTAGIPASTVVQVPVGGATAAAVVSAPVALRAFNVPAGLAVLFAAAFGGGFVGKKLLPTVVEVKEEGDQGNVLQLERKPKQEGAFEVDVLQLEPQPKQERAFEVEVMGLQTSSKEEEMLRNKQAGERLVEEALSRYQAATLNTEKLGATLMPAAAVAVAPPLVVEDVPVLEDVAAAVTVAPPLVVEDVPVLEDVAEVQEAELEVALTVTPAVEVEVLAPVAEQMGVEESNAVVVNSETLEWERKKQELVQNMAGGVAIILAVASFLQ